MGMVILLNRYLALYYAFFAAASALEHYENTDNTPTR